MSEYHPHRSEPRPIHHAATESRLFLESCLRISLLKEDEWAEDRLIDFNLWASGVGVFAKPPASLDDRLKHNEDVQSVVLSLLSTFNIFLKLCVDHGMIYSYPRIEFCLLTFREELEAMIVKFPGHRPLKRVTATYSSNTITTNNPSMQSKKMILNQLR